MIGNERIKFQIAHTKLSYSRAFIVRAVFFRMMETRKCAKKQLILHVNLFHIEVPVRPCQRGAGAVEEFTTSRQKHCRQTIHCSEYTERALHRWRAQSAAEFSS